MIERAGPMLLWLGASAVWFGLGCPQEASRHEDAIDLCSDGIDNDGDGATDCDDLGCVRFCGGDGDSDTDADGETDGGGDGDADTDADGDADTDTHADGDADTDADVDEDVDTRPPIIPCAGDGDCPDTLRCYDYALDGVQICAPRGATCLGAASCGAGVDCGVLAIWFGSGAFCMVTGEGCACDGQCPDGFRCEGGSCVDRRVVCADNDGCPWWDVCGPLRSEIRICQPSGPEPCTDAEMCSERALCVDIEGDGDTECQPTTGSTCATNADCVGAVCGDEDGLRGSECGSVGPCLTSGDCPAGRECVDVNGDGNLECQPTGGACLTDAECPPGRICWDPDGMGGAGCVGG